MWPLQPQVVVWDWHVILWCLRLGLWFIDSTTQLLITLFLKMIDIACAVVQTFGGKNLLRVGVILQRGIIILLMFCLPCWGLLINAQAILLCMGQDPEVARWVAVPNMQQCYHCKCLSTLTNNISGLKSVLYRVRLSRYPIYSICTGTDSFHIHNMC